MAIVIITISALFTIFMIDLLVFFSSTNSLSFSFKTFTPDDTRITYERGASVNPVNHTIDLIPDILSIGAVGRATYFDSFQLWDPESRNLSDFTTHFTFAIDSRGNKLYADGLAFFLAPAGSKLNLNTRGGGSMGLTWDDESVNNTHGDPFVAVEFDIYQNYFDPEYEHVGIDLNSMVSKNVTRWWCDLEMGRRNEAWISYNSSSMVLSVVFTGWNNSNLIPSSLFQEVDLRTLLPPHVTLGFSAATGHHTALYSIFSWEFNSTLHVRGKERKRKTQAVVGLGIGGVGLALAGGFGWAWLLLRKRRRSEDNYDMELIDDDFEGEVGPRRYSYHEIERATNNFDDEANKLGEGGFGSVYKGYLSDINSLVAVKKLSEESKQGLKEFVSEVRVFSQLRHRNLVKLIGWCNKKRNLLLVYEFMPNGSLDRHLLRATELLTWDARYEIAKGLTSALLYLHEGWEKCVVHRDIKPSNIMLDSDFNAKLGDFGLARFLDHAKGSKTTDVVGTRGYMAPEYVLTSRATKETDVYSFGIVFLEIACGRKPINPNLVEGQVVLVDWVWKLYEEGKLVEAADCRFNVGDYDERQMEKLLVIGIWCAHPDYCLRPSIRQVSLMLNDGIPLPSPPPRMLMEPWNTNPTTSSIAYETASSQF